MQIADTILAQPAAAFEWTTATDHPASSGISLGITIAPADARDLATLLELADAVLYQAKPAGGHQARVAQPALRRKARHVSTAAARAPRSSRRSSQDVTD